MTLRTRLMLFTAAAALSTGMAQAAITAQGAAQAFLDQQYSYVEVKEGLTQIKVEAVKDGTKIEVVYDKATGAILKSETEYAGDDYDNKTGVEIEDEDKDFVGDKDDDSEDDGEDDDHDESDDDHDDDDHDDDDHDEGDDDHGDDDHGDDDHDNDHEGRGGGESGGRDGGDDD